jgi:hypothetical protein
VTQAAQSGANLVPPIVAAVEAHATVGEIADAMRSVFGEHTETATLRTQNSELRTENSELGTRTENSEPGTNPEP